MEVRTKWKSESHSVIHARLLQGVQDNAFSVLKIKFILLLFLYLFIYNSTGGMTKSQNMEKLMEINSKCGIIENKFYIIN